jgi:type IV pilus assembly protein PilO
MKRRDLYLVGGLVAILVVALYWFFVLSPLRGKIDDTQTQIDAANTQLVSLQAQMALLELSKMLPDQDEIPSLLLQIQDLATESGIDFMMMTPSKAAATSSSGTYQTIPLSLQFAGTFFDVNDFLYRIEQLAAAPGRILSVQNLTLTPSGTAAVGVSPTLSATMTLLAYKSVPTTTPAAGGSTGTAPSKAG